MEDQTLERLEDQISWYDRKSSYNQTAFKGLKVLTIVSAAIIPLLSIFPDLHWITAAVGVLIAVSEGIQQINQYNANWISYRSTCEALKHEKFLYFATAGPYSTATNAHTLLRTDRIARFTRTCEMGLEPRAGYEVQCDS